MRVERIFLLSQTPSCPPKNINKNPPNKCLRLFISAFPKLSLYDTERNKSFKKKKKREQKPQSTRAFSPCDATIRRLSLNFAERCVARLTLPIKYNSSAKPSIGFYKHCTGKLGGIGPKSALLSPFYNMDTYCLQPQFSIKLINGIVLNVAESISFCRQIPRDYFLISSIEHLAYKNM